jgi:hypothetical protein
MGKYTKAQDLREEREWAKRNHKRLWRILSEARAIMREEKRKAKGA